MEKTVILIICCTILFINPISISTEIRKTNLNDYLEGSWIENKVDFKVLFLNGSNYNMGYQHGYYLKTNIQENIRCVNSFCDYFGWTYNKRMDVWNIQKEYMPQCYIEEIQGMADGSGLSFEEIALYNMWYDLLNIPHCWGSSLWGSATTDGSLYHMRSADGSFGAKDPVTGKYLHENSALIIRNPKDGYASIVPEFIGDIFVYGGFNEKGIGVSELTVKSSDSQFHGLSGGFRMRMVLDFAYNIFKAIEILNSNRTTGTNFIVSDGNLNVGYVIEQSANLVYTGSWCDTVESTKPFWQIKDVVRRGNCYINPLLAKNELNRHYDPSGLLGLLRCLLHKDWHFVQWTQYKAISKEIEKQYGTLDLDSTMTLLRDVYHGKTNLVFRKIQKHNTYNSGHQWLGCPKTGDILVSFGNHKNHADKNPVNRFNLFDLLNYKPSGLQNFLKI